MAASTRSLVGALRRSVWPFESANAPGAESSGVGSNSNAPSIAARAHRRHRGRISQAARRIGRPIVLHRSPSESRSLAIGVMVVVLALPFAD
jgi:hypothetical protein